MFVGFNADSLDGFAVVALKTIPANSVIHFNDNEWNGLSIGSGGAFNNASETELSWYTGIAAILPGTVVTFNQTNNSGTISVTTGTVNGTISLAAGNEVLYAFLGTDSMTPTTFLSAISNDGFGAGPITNTGLTAGTDAIEITGDEDVMVYSGSTTCNTTIAACAALIADVGNWSTQDGGGEQHNDGTSPDFPTDVPPFFIINILPVTIISLEAKEENSTCKINWETAQEFNSDYFILESSDNGQNWKEIG